VCCSGIDCVFQHTSTHFGGRPEHFPHCYGSQGSCGCDVSPPTHLPSVYYLRRIICITPNYLRSHVILLYYLSVSCHVIYRAWNASLLTDQKEISIVKTLVASAQELESQAHEELHHLHQQHQQYDHLTDNINPNSKIYRNLWLSSIGTVVKKIGVRKQIRAAWGRWVLLKVIEIIQCWLFACDGCDLSCLHGLTQLLSSLSLTIHIIHIE
jgi:hypothetical protein